MKAGRVILYIVLAVLLVGTMTGVGIVLGSVAQTRSDQESLTPFYTPPATLPAPGSVIRTEPLTFPDTGFTLDLPGATAYRMLYVSTRPDGTPAASGAMVFVPNSPAPPDGRPVVAWAHGTVGMGDACAPSRSPRGTNDMSGWLEQMMSLGWVVVATDYVGLGTPGPELYLVAEAEVDDVINSVRAVRAMPEAQASARYAVFGHSQGGHSSLWAGHLAPEKAPDLELVGVAAAAPAAELTPIVEAQWDGVVGWVIGPEALIAWQYGDPQLQLEGVVTKAGIDNFERLADECINLAALEGLARNKLGQSFFEIDPLDSPTWKAVVDQQTPPPLPADMPVMVSQGLADQVVLPWPNAILQEKWCAAGSTLSMEWMGDVDHMKAAIVSGPQVVAWIADRFAGRPAPRTCDVPPPVPPRPPSP
ncbi:MAG: lipase family protein [Actinomycetales bacterium]|nr:lipase family protein [Actinomycetales bacterium]